MQIVRFSNIYFYNIKRLELALRNAWSFNKIMIISIKLTLKFLFGDIQRNVFHDDWVIRYIDWILVVGLYFFIFDVPDNYEKKSPYDDNSHSNPALNVIEKTILICRIGYFSA